MYADLHIHSTASDGTLVPEEIVELALQKNLSVISLTDHDTTDGIDRALNSAKGTNLEVIPGVEISTDWEDTEVHILGYYIDYHSQQLQEVLYEMRQARDLRAAKIIEKLKDLGISIDYEHVKKIAGKAPVGRPHIARAMVECGYVSSINDAFEGYLARGKPGYVPRIKMHPYEAISIIEKANGVPVLAHPGLMNRDSLIPALVKKGLLGIEVFYPLHDQEMTEKYKWYCRKYALVTTGGTDHHGPGTGYPMLGEVGVDREDVENLKFIYSLLA
ncbi:MAG TPA: PHP domain-containing protein [Syntrophomonadaceae bacterium]|nr:PHP domain-containing protein [Syntrophomonadaceae bacterium]